MKRISKAVQIVSLKRNTHFKGQLHHTSHSVSLLRIGLEVFTLSFENARGVTRDPGVEHDDTLLQPLNRLFLANDGIGEDSVIFIKLNEVQASESGGVLILFANRLATNVDFDVAGFLGQGVGGHEVAPMCVKRAEKTNRESTRRAESRPP